MASLTVPDITTGIRCEFHKETVSSARTSVSLKTNFTANVLKRQTSYLGAILTRSEKKSISTTGNRVPKVYAAKRVSSQRNYVLNATLVALEGKEEEVMKLCKGILAWADEKKKDKRSGLVSFECNVDAYEKNVFHFWERYDSFPNMNDARASPEHSNFMQQVRPLLASPVALAAYEYRDGQLGCMMNPIGPKGEGGLDDATGQGGSGGGASYKQTSSGVQQGLSEVPKESKNVWGLKQALRLSSAKDDKASEAAASAQEAAVSAAQKIAEGLANLFGIPKKKQ